jgi:phage terminase small subunit
MAYDFSKFTEMQRRFCEEYVLCLNRKEAATRAGYSDGGQSYTVFDLPHVQDYIDYLVAKRAERVSIKQDEVLARLWTIATTDVNELVEYRRCACRHCHGKNFNYQWTDDELKRAQAEAKRLGFPLPSAPGGAGFDRTKEPHPDCPECNGEGDGRVHAHDTRKVSDAAKMLYAGAEVGRDGLKIKTHDQMRALELVGKHLGMFKDKVEHSGEVKNSGPVLNLTLTSPDAPKVETPAAEE